MAKKQNVLSEILTYLILGLAAVAFTLLLVPKAVIWLQPVTQAVQEVTHYSRSSPAGIYVDAWNAAYDQGCEDVFVRHNEGQWVSWRVRITHNSRDNKYYWAQPPEDAWDGRPTTGPIAIHPLPKINYDRGLQAGEIVSVQGKLSDINCLHTTIDGHVHK